MRKTSVSDEQLIKETWSRYWSRKNGVIEEWDSLSEIILQTLLRECNGVHGLRILEAGCGTGRISGRLANAGASVICLDISPQALDLVRKSCDGASNIELVLGSILELPRLQACDIIWNAGVLEHFVNQDQQRAIDEFLGALKESGRVIILTPYSGSCLYRAAKFILEVLGRWHYGRETPVYSLAEAMPSRGRLEREYTIAFLPLIFDAYKFIPPLKIPLLAVWATLQRVLGARGCAYLDGALSWLVGGYLLVSVVSLRKGAK